MSSLTKGQEGKELGIQDLLPYVAFIKDVKVIMESRGGANLVWLKESY